MTTHHEDSINEFYSSGLDKCDIDDIWPLTYGYWTSEDNTYEEAAKNMWNKLYNSANIIRDESVVVVVAFGMGLELIHLFQEYQPKKIYGVDVTEAHVERARNLIQRHNLQDRIEVIHGSGTRLNEYLNTKVTHVLCVEGTIQMDNRQGFYQSAYDILIEGGIFGFCDSCVKRYDDSIANRVFKSLISNMWLVPVENMQTIDDIVKDLTILNYNIKIRESFGDHVWIPYCDAKLREFDDDVRRRGHLNAFKLYIINETLRWGCCFTDNIDYYIILGVK